MQPSLETQTWWELNPHWGTQPFLGTEPSVGKKALFWEPNTSKDPACLVEPRPLGDRTVTGELNPPRASRSPGDPTLFWEPGSCGSITLLGDSSTRGAVTPNVLTVKLTSSSSWLFTCRKRMSFVLGLVWPHCKCPNLAPYLQTES